MLELTHLPDDIWSILLRLDPVCDRLSALLSTGNRALYSRVTRNCRIFRTQASLKERAVQSFPPFLKTLLALEEVSFHVASLDSNQADVVAELLQLPNTLKTLVVTYKGASKLLLTPHAPTSSLPSQTSAAYDDKDHLPVETWDIASHFPHLETLEVFSPMNGEDDPIDATVACLAHFPPNLTRLRWPIQFTLEDDFSLLPRSLTSLSLERSLITAASAKTLPPRLIHLEGATTTDVDAVSALPRTLETGDWYCPPFASFTAAIAAALPPRIQHLNHSCFVDDRSLWVHLPKFLKSFVSITNIGPADISWLPRTLESLRFRITCSSAQANLDNLREATLSNPEDFRSVWPPSVHTLSRLDLLYAKDIDFLPSSLTAIEEMFLESAEEERQVLARYAGLLPPRLTTLVSISHSSWKFLPPIEWSTSSLLPRGLTELRLPTALLPPGILLNLPPRLTVLYLNRTRIVEDDSWPIMAQLPRTLTSLGLRAFDHRAIPLLPPDLKNLCVRNICGPLPKCVFAGLPKGLESFEWTFHKFPLLSTPFANLEAPSDPSSTDSSASSSHYALPVLFSLPELNRLTLGGKPLPSSVLTCVPPYINKLDMHLVGIDPACLPLIAPRWRAWL